MVKLNKIYTRTGDDGETSLVNGQRVAKHALRPEAFGSVDELNSTLGVCRLYTAQLEDEACDAMLGRIQNDLFDLGADLATPLNETETKQDLRITDAQVARLEAEIDAMNAGLEPLSSFILPGGAEAAAYMHLARAQVRRAERKMTHLASHESVSSPAMRFINRLSDHFFVMARYINTIDNTEVLWKPGMHTGLSP